MNVEKLKRLQAQVRIGGKGTPRRKKKVVHQTATNDDKKLQSSLKKLSVSTIPGIEEVNIIKDDLTVIHFNNPKAQASLSANTFAVTGHGEHKKIVEMLPEILPQLGQETVVQLRMFANSMSSNSQKQQNAGAVCVVARGVAEEDDVPMLVSDFDEIAKVEAANDSKPAAPKQKSNDSLKALTIDTKPKNLNDGNAQKESNNNEKQSEGSVAEKLNINVASMPAAEKPIDTASAGKSQKEEQSDDGKANAKANKNSKGDNKSQPRGSKPTAAIKQTEDSTPIAVDQTQNIAVKSSKSVEQKATKDSDKKEAIEPVEGKQTKKHDKPKESKSNKKGQADKEGQQDKKKAQLEKAPLQIPETKEIETEIKLKKNQDHAMVVTPKEEERVQKQKSPLKGECKQNEEKVKQPPLQVQPQDVEKEIVEDTNVLELAKQPEPLKEAVVLVQTQDKKVNETEKDENSITPKDIQIKQVVQQKTPKANVMSVPGDTKQKTDAQKKGQAPKKEITKKTETDIQKDQSTAKLTESNKDVVPQEHAPSKPKQQNKKKEKTSLKPAPVTLETNKKDANVQPPYPDIQHEKGKKEQPKRREQSPIPLKDVKKETCQEKEDQQVHAQAKIEDISKVTETSVKLAAKPDNIKTIGNEQKNLFTNQPQSKQQTEHKLDESEPMTNVVEALETRDIRPSANILEQMVKQVTDELKVMDTSKKVTDKSIEIVLPNEGLKSIPKTDDVEASLVDAVVASKPAEVKQQAAKSSDECFKSSASVESQVTGLDMMAYPEVYHVPVSKPAEAKQEPSTSVESLKSSTLEGSEVMELNVKQSADLLPAPKATAVKEEPAKSVDEDLKSSPPELGQVKGPNMSPTEELVSASKPAEAKHEAIMSGDECLKSSATVVIQAKEVDMTPTAGQVPVYETSEAKQELIVSGDQCLKSSTSELGQAMQQNTTTIEDQVSANKPDEIKKEPIKSCDEGLKCSSPQVVQSKEVDVKPIVQVQQQPGVELEPQPIKCDNKMGETAAPPQKDSPPRQNANKKNTTPQLQDKEGAKQHQNKQTGGGNKATLQSEGKKTEAAKPKQTSPVKTHQQQQQQAGKQTGCNASKQQQQQQQQQQVKAAPTKSPEKPVVAPKPASAPTKSVTPPKAVTPTKTMAATSAPSQPKKSPSGEDGGSSAPIGKKQTQKDGGGNNKAKQTSPKHATAPAGAAAATGAVVEGTTKQASPPKTTEQAAVTPQIGQQPSAN